MESVLDQLNIRTVGRLKREKIRPEHVEFMFLCMPPEMKNFLDIVCTLADAEGETVHVRQTKDFVASGIGALDQPTKNMIRKIMGCPANPSPREIEITGVGILIAPCKQILLSQAQPLAV